jgi:purine-binding chemotaxis protein CheW
MLSHQIAWGSRSSLVRKGEVARVENQQFMLVFEARRHLCAMPAEQVVETLRPLAVEPLAAAHDFILGLSAIRDRSVPVVDVGALLGTGGERNCTRFIVLRVEERFVALAVEAVLGVRKVASRSLQDLPPLLGEASTAHITSIGALDSAFLLVLRAGRVRCVASMRSSNPKMRNAFAPLWRAGLGLNWTTKNCGR